MASKKTFIWAIGPRINADVIALDRKPNGAQNFVNQLMTNAKLIETNADARIFADAHGKYRLEAHTKQNVVNRITKALKSVDEVASTNGAEFYGQYKVTFHARERYAERFGNNRNEAKTVEHLNNILRSATFQSVTLGSKGDTMHNYNAEKHNMRLVISKETQTIITVHAIESVQPTLTADSPLFEVLIKTARRELTKATARFRKQQRIMTAELSAIQIEIAKSAVNRTRAKGEHIVMRIDEKVTKMQRKADEIAERLVAIESEHGRIASDVKRLTGGA